MIKSVTQQVDGQTSKQPINWMGAPKSTHVRPLAWRNKNTNWDTIHQIEGKRCIDKKFRC